MSFPEQVAMSDLHQLCAETNMVEFICHMILMLRIVLFILYNLGLSRFFPELGTKRTSSDTLVQCQTAVKFKYPSKKGS